MNGGYSVTSKAKKLQILAGDCNNPDIRDISFHDYHSVTELIIGSDNFQNVDRVSLENLPFLQSVSVGSNSFTNHPDSFGSNADRELIISNCTSLTNITTDSFAFSDYNNLNMIGMRDIERMNNWIELPSLESLVLGNPNSPSNNFYDASLQLKSGSEFYFLSRFPFSCWSNSW